MVSEFFSTEQQREAFVENYMEIVIGINQQKTEVDAGIEMIQNNELSQFDLGVYVTITDMLELSVRDVVDELDSLISLVQENLQNPPA